jgi:hypothetical protein
MRSVLSELFVVPHQKSVEFYCLFGLCYDGSTLLQQILPKINALLKRKLIFKF